MNGDWIGLIPAAGQGLRLGLPYPKELYPVIRDNRYKPIAQFVLDCLTDGEVEHTVFVVNETKFQLMGYFGDGRRFGCKLSYVVQEPRIDDGSSTSPGLAHAIDSAYHLTEGKTVFFGMADTIMQPPTVFKLGYEAMDSETEVLLILFQTSSPEKFGMVRVDEHDKVLSIDDKPQQTDLTEMWGAIIWRPAFTKYIHRCVRQERITDFAEIMNRAIEDGLNFKAFHVQNGVYIDLGTYDEIMELNRRLREE